MNSKYKYEMTKEEDVKYVWVNQCNAKVRKQTPVYSGFIKYFPNAIKEVSKLSLIANKQHHPGTPLHWDMEKSKDELDACIRHLIDHASGIEIDEDGVRHLTKCAWRMMAMLERTLTDKF